MTEWPAPLAQVGDCCIAPPFPTINAFFDDCAERFGDRTAINCFEDGETLSYNSYCAVSSDLGRGMAAQGMLPGTMVCTMLPNCMDYPVVWGALQRAGAGMVPVPTTYTASELRFILEDCKAGWLIIDAEFLPILAALDPSRRTQLRVVVRNAPDGGGWQDLSMLYSGDASRFEAEGLGPDSLSGLQYTSGTTGSPKGCIVTHDYWGLLCRALYAQFRNPVRNILSPHQFNYMNGRNLMMVAMQQGGIFFLARRHSSSRFLGWIHDLQIHFCFFPELILKQPETLRDRQTPLMEVALANAAPQVQLEFTRRFGVTAFELYGMTEVGAVLAGDTSDPSFWGSGRLGIEMLGRAVTIRDEDGTEVPDGTEGELWTCGPGMMKGYFGRPDADAEIFRGKWVRTGDRVMRREDGYIYFLGRLKDIVRRSNENISCREVEGVARLFPGVQEASVVPQPDPERGEEVKIFLQLKPGMETGAGLVHALHQHFQAHLAAFKCPRFYAFVADFPRTISLKISKGELRKGDYPVLWSFDRANLKT